MSVPWDMIVFVICLPFVLLVRHSIRTARNRHRQQTLLKAAAHNEAIARLEEMISDSSTVRTRTASGRANP